MEEKSGVYVWTWQTTFTAEREVTITAYGVCQAIARLFSVICGLGLRLSQNLFEGGKVFPGGVECGKNLELFKEFNALAVLLAAIEILGGEKP